MSDDEADDQSDADDDDDSANSETDEDDYKQTDTQVDSGAVVMSLGVSTKLHNVETG